MVNDGRKMADIGRPGKNSQLFPGVNAEAFIMNIKIKPVIIAVRNFLIRCRDYCFLCSGFFPVSGISGSGSVGFPRRTYMPNES